MKILLTTVNQLDGKWLPSTTSYSEAASPLGALQELAYRTQTNWEKLPSGWYKERGKLKLLHVGEDPQPPLPEIHTYYAEEYVKQSDGALDLTHCVRHQVLALSEREAVAAIYRKTLQRSQRISPNFGGKFRRFSRGWESPFTVLIFTENPNPE